MLNNMKQKTMPSFLNNQYSNSIFNKIILLSAVICFVAISFILLFIPSAKGYEYSVYEIYPSIFWILLGILFSFPFAYILLTASNRLLISFQEKTAFGLLIISVATILLILFIPLIRGYLSADGDTYQHIGYIIDICNSGFIPIDHYPYSHVFVSIILIILDVHNIHESNFTHYFIPFYFVIYIISIFCLSRSIGCDRYQVIIITSLSTIPIMGNFISGGNILPSTIGWLMIPLFLHCLYNMGFTHPYNRNYLILGIILSITFWFIHPETVLFPSIWITTVIIVMIGTNFLYKHHYFDYFHLFYILLILLIGFIFYFSYTSAFESQIKTYAGYISGESSTYYSPFNQIASHATFTRKIIVLIESYGQIIVTSFLSILFLIYYFIKQKPQQWKQNYLIISILFSVTILVSIVFLTLGSGIGVHIFRQYKYILLFSLFILGFYFSDILLLISMNLPQKIFSIIFIVLLIIIIIVSISNCFPSPNIGQINQQATFQDISGMQLFYENRDPDFPILETLTRFHQLQYFWFLYGYSIATNIQTHSLKTRGVRPPSGFGYEKFETLGLQYPSNTYFLKYPPINPYQYWFTQTEEYFNLITPQNYSRLECDFSVNKIQDGGELQIYLILPNRVKELFYP